MSKLMEILRSQAGRLSLGRVACVVAFLLWIGTWLYTLLFKVNYGHFDTVTIATLILFFVVLLGKRVDSKIISVEGDGKK